MNNSEPNNEVTLISEGQKIVACRKKLAATSKYFNVMFNSDVTYVESKAEQVTIEGVSPCMLQVLVDFSNNNEVDINIDADQSLDLLSAACMLQFEKAIHLTEQYVSRMMTCENCLATLSVADSCGLKQLYNKAKRVSLWYFEEVAKSHHFLELPLELLKEYIFDSMLNAPNELVVFEAIQRWAGYDKTRLEAMKDIVLILISMSSLDDLKTLQETPFISENEIFQNQVKKTLQKADVRDSHSTPSRHVPRELLAVGGHFQADDSVEGRGNKDISNTDVLMLEGDGLVPLTTLPHDDVEKLWGYSACVLGKDLYVIGGAVKSTGVRHEWTGFIWCYDSLKNSWEHVSQLPGPRRHHSVLAWKSHLYVVGGFGKFRIVQDTVYKYDTIQDTWENLPNLIDPVYSAAITTCGDDLYVIKHSIQILKPDATRWQQLVADLPYEICIHSAVNVGVDIYILGLHSKKLSKLNTVTNQVTQIGLFESCSGYGCLHNRMIYAIGGEDSQNIEAYDIATGLFSVVCKLDKTLINHSVVSFPKYPKFR